VQAVDIAPASAFGRLAAAVLRNPRSTVLGLLLVSLISLGLATRLRVDPSLIQLLPQDDPTTKAIVDLLHQDGGVELLTIAVKGARPEQLDGFMHELVDRMEALEAVDYALYDIEPELAWRIGLMQLDETSLSTMKTNLKGAINLGPALNPMIAGHLFGSLIQDTEKLKKGGQPSVLSSTDGVARVIIRPDGSAKDTVFSRALMADVYEILEELQPEARGVKVVWVGGAYRHAVEDIEGIADDLKWTAVVSVVLVLSLIALAFRDARAILMIFGPLLIGNLWTFGYAAVSVGSLNTFTSFFAAVLIGLGVDFSIHLYSRYREVRAGGLSQDAAIIEAWSRSGPPCMAAALTSALGFCALWMADFRGFQQMGTLLAGGVILCLVAVLVALPLFIRWADRTPVRLGKERVRWRLKRRNPTYRLAPVALLLVGILSIACATTLNKIEFEYDMSELRSHGLSFADLPEEQRKLAQDSYLPVVLDFPDSASLTEAHIRFNEGIEAGTLKEIQRVLSIHSVLPVDQDARLKILREIAELARHENVKFLPPQIQQNLSRIREADLARMTVEDLPHNLRSVLGADRDRHWLMLFASGNMWDLRQTVDLYDAVQKWAPGVPAAGSYLAVSALYQLCRDDAPRITMLALFLVALMTMLHMKSPRRGVGAVAALVVGLCWAGAGLALFRVKLSMINFVGVPILMGIGIDVVIHLLHRMAEEGPGRILKALATTGMASAISSATTILSFAALTVAGNQGVRSLGLIIVLGLALVTLAAFTTVPLGWMTTWKVRGQVGEQDGGEE
jgi:predicted RND superfamily exporter protein